MFRAAASRSAGGGGAGELIAEPAVAGMAVGPVVPEHGDLEAFHGDRRREHLQPVGAVANQARRDQRDELRARHDLGHGQAMLDLGADMARLGVQFVRPITNFEPIWTLTGASR